ncbi:proepiregulin [Rhinatrema bivittatum]|uniref:proepiregulin n=1 Tax=Rhinatrema bivittatum TaxID=194408 RepID=UPI00112E1C82|nr:proepiregulin [Rhinatrema bivittatum]
MDCWKKAHRLCVFLGLYVLQTACGTTMGPLCKDGESCTTALEHSSQVTQVTIVKCRSEMEDYCFHGQCMYLEEADTHFCRCDKGYIGSRCLHSELVIQPVSREYVALTVVLIVFFLLAIALVLFFAYKRYRAKRCKQPKKEYHEVTTVSV